MSFYGRVCFVVIASFAFILGEWKRNWKIIKKPKEENVDDDNKIKKENTRKAENEENK